MAAEKVTLMKLKVDLDCDKCYKKVKKILCKFPQIRDQKYDVKDNHVFITVVCCSPEKIRDKLCCKGGGTIKSIEIVELPKPKPPEPRKDSDKPKDTPKADDKPKDKPKADDKPKDKPDQKKVSFEEPKKGGGDEKPKKADDKPKDKPAPGPVSAHPVVAVPAGMMVYAPAPCYGGMPAGPGFYGNGGPAICYDGYYGRPVYDSYGGSRPYYVNNRCDHQYEENPEGCVIM